jgi:hypothetical protein
MDITTTDEAPGWALEVVVDEDGARINGEPLEPWWPDGNYCRRLYRVEDAWILKEDNDGLAQGQAEFEFWKYLVEDSDRPLFVPTVAAGPIADSWQCGYGWCLQRYYPDLQEVTEVLDTEQVRTVAAMVREVKDRYELKDMAMRQVKITDGWWPIIHDYSINTASPEWDDYDDFISDLSDWSE